MHPCTLAHGSLKMTHTRNDHWDPEKLMRGHCEKFRLEDSREGDFEWLWQVPAVWEYVPFHLGKLKGINMNRPIRSVSTERGRNSYCAVGAAGNRHWIGPQKTQADEIWFIHELRQTL